MFTLHAAFGPELPGNRGPFFLHTAVAVCLSAALAIAQAANVQEPAPAAKPQDAKPPAAKPQAGTPADTAPAAVAPKLGRVVADSVALRCWPGSVAAPPVLVAGLALCAVAGYALSQGGHEHASEALPT